VCCVRIVVTRLIGVLCRYCGDTCFRCVVSVLWGHVFSVCCVRIVVTRVFGVMCPYCGDTCVRCDVSVLW